MAELLRKTICNHSKFLRVEIANALAKSGSLKAIEILAATSRHSQIALNSIELTAVLLERLAPQPSPTSSPKKAQLDEPSMNTLPSTGLEGWDPRASATSSDKMTNRLADRQLKFCQVVKEIIQQMLKVGTSSREARMLFRQAVRQHKAGSNGKEALDEDYLELMYVSSFVEWFMNEANIRWSALLIKPLVFAADFQACRVPTATLSLTFDPRKVDVHM
ncbi:hypothetical protein Pst134EB_029794 [Puccinia striiformis f. sp. tritici]|nr:hypothetical protein Pst134EB_029794 [Puccinia striiformis f. sp. tritici]